MTVPDEGLLLAFDTSGAEGSVAVARDGKLMTHILLDEASEHAARLLPGIEEALEMVEARASMISGLVVGEGPGSFTGVRGAAATAKGLAHALGVPLWALSSLAAAAVALPVAVAPIRYMLFDARGDRIYGGCYDVRTSGVTTVLEPHAGTIQDVLSDVPYGATFAGDGARRHQALLESAGYEVCADEVWLADGLLEYLDLEPDLEPVADVAGWEPRYVRASSAERLWIA